MAKRSKKSARVAKKAAAKPTLLSGGNPRIAKADGDAPVQAYIVGMPGWKRDLGKRLDALIVRNVPNVRKGVKWNSPFYGIEGQGWFLGFHTFTRYVKVAFFRGTSLRPVPPGASKSKDTRYLDIHEGDALDEAQMALGEAGGRVARFSRLAPPDALLRFVKATLPRPAHWSVTQPTRAAHETRPGNRDQVRGPRRTIAAPATPVPGEGNPRCKTEIPGVGLF